MESRGAAIIILVQGSDVSVVLWNIFKKNSLSLHRNYNWSWAHYCPRMLPIYVHNINFLHFVWYLIRRWSQQRRLLLVHILCQLLHLEKYQERNVSNGVSSPEAVDELLHNQPNPAPIQSIHCPLRGKWI